MFLARPAGDAVASDRALRNASEKSMFGCQASISVRLEEDPFAKRLASTIIYAVHDCMIFFDFSLIRRVPFTLLLGTIGTVIELHHSEVLCKSCLQLMKLMIHKQLLSKLMFQQIWIYQLMLVGPSIEYCCAEFCRNWWTFFDLIRSS